MHSTYIFKVSFLFLTDYKYNTAFSTLQVYKVPNGVKKVGANAATIHLENQ